MQWGKLRWLIKSISIASTETNNNKKDSLLREAATLQKESQLLLEDADKSLEVASMV